MAKIKLQPIEEEKLPFTIKVTPVDSDSIKKSWDRIKSVISNQLETANNKDSDHENKNSDKPHQ